MPRRAEPHAALSWLCRAKGSRVLPCQPCRLPRHPRNPGAPAFLRAPHCLRGQLAPKGKPRAPPSLWGAPKPLGHPRLRSFRVSVGLGRSSHFGDTSLPCEHPPTAGAPNSRADPRSLAHAAIPGVPPYPGGHPIWLGAPAHRDHLTSRGTSHTFGEPPHPRCIPHRHPRTEGTAAEEWGAAGCPPAGGDTPRPCHHGGRDTSRRHRGGRCRRLAPPLPAPEVARGSESGSGGAGSGGSPVRAAGSAPSGLGALRAPSPPRYRHDPARGQQPHHRGDPHAEVRGRGRRVGTRGPGLSGAGTGTGTEAAGPGWAGPEPRTEGGVRGAGWTARPDR